MRAKRYVCRTLSILCFCVGALFALGIPGLPLQEGPDAPAGGELIVAVVAAGIIALLAAGSGVALWKAGKGNPTSAPAGHPEPPEYTQGEHKPAPRRPTESGRTGVEQTGHHGQRISETPPTAAAVDSAGAQDTGHGSVTASTEVAPVENTNERPGASSRGTGATTQRAGEKNGFKAIAFGVLLLLELAVFVGAVETVTVELVLDVEEGLSLPDWPVAAGAVAAVVALVLMAHPVTSRGTGFVLTATLFLGFATHFSNGFERDLVHAFSWAVVLAIPAHKINRGVHHHIAENLRR